MALNSELIGSNSRFWSVLKDVETVASTDCAVLIEGETGTGKELIARAIHDSCPRRRQRFVAINCAAIPASLLESELFGHERGAFPGAITSRIGRFQAADHGTLFLDEIGELPLDLQPKLLRAIQEREFERLGTTHTTRIDVRIIAATNRSLAQMVRENMFRADLYYRLNVFPIVLPALRERQSDIPLLVKYFVKIFSERYGKAIASVPDDAMRAMERYSWPGNIREMQNFIERSVILTKGTELSAQVAELQEAEEEVGSALEDVNRAHILATLREVRGVVGGRHGAAARLGLPRTTLITKMQKLGIRSTATQTDVLHSTSNENVVQASA